MTERTPRHGDAESSEPPQFSDPLTEIEQRAGRQSAAGDAPVTIDVSGARASTVGASEPVIGSSEPAAIALNDDQPVFGAGSTALGASKGTVRMGDRVFRGLTEGAGLFVVLLIALVAVFLLVKAIPAIAHDKSNFLTSRQWDVDGATLHFGVLPLLYVTVAISVLAMAIAVPVAIGIALFITNYAPARLARPVAYVIDLLAAIPSIIYGVWGIEVLAPRIQPVADFFTSKLGGFALFKDYNVKGGSIFSGGVVLAIMILPIVTAVARDVFERTPRQNVEAAWALGATRWEMIRLAVLPYGRPGLVSGAMLGLGRALGETIAISLILSKVSNSGDFSWSLFNGGETFASKIANNASEFNGGRQTGAFIAAGLVLFVLTFAVNAAARAVVNRRREFS
ncbi:phosphate ABC transporter permease subunit PstC [Jatrophihabitans telluris]|uniref:Phosphate transport system permease protein n=1 Tax=Jatrophihabitans telluris TaxID=2038343 RepID=A0ABY4QYX5_9ACTN|nr:phosphate ABC transporter permease subunit PstC [Jatrophihabitans telluris]UQX88774.1 phosphate ABC transporter permease subunit PstC [Jatrophihabitans telluris]